MSGILKLKNNIRGFCRKQDEIVSPLLRFVGALMLFMSIQKLFNYSSLGSKKEITFLLAVLSALLPDGFMFFMAGTLITLHSFCVSIEVGIVFVLLFIIMYCVYVRFFPNYAYAILLVPVFYCLHIPFAAPIIIALVAGIGGLVPSVFGVILYYFSECAATVSQLLATGSEENEIEAIKQLSEVLVSNKQMYTTCVIFAITILVTSLLAKLTFDYGVYIAIAAGTIVNILGSIFAGAVTGQDVDMGLVLAGSLVGALIAIIVRFGQGVLDYQHVERVQFEDDDFYYYVKAVPKFDSEKKDQKKARPVKKETEKNPEPEMINAEDILQQDPVMPQNPDTFVMQDIQESNFEPQPEFRTQPDYTQTADFEPQPEMSSPQEFAKADEFTAQSDFAMQSDFSSQPQQPHPTIQIIPQQAEFPWQSEISDEPVQQEPEKKSGLRMAPSNRSTIQMPPGYDNQ